METEQHLLDRDIASLAVVWCEMAEPDGDVPLRGMRAATPSLVRVDRRGESETELSTYVLRSGTNVRSNRETVYGYRLAWWWFGAVPRFSGNETSVSTEHDTTYYGACTYRGQGWTFERKRRAAHAHATEKTPHGDRHTGRAAVS